MPLAAFAMVALLSFAVAGYAIVAYGFMPLGALVQPEMRAAFKANPLAVYAHVFASALALLIGPLQFSERLRDSRRELHRWLGRLYLGIGVLVGGVAGMYMAFHAFGGIASQLGFAVLALLWLYTGWRAFRAIRARDVPAHRRWMIRNFALTLAAVTLRLWLPAALASGIAFELAYPVIAWLCWVPNLLVAEHLVQRRPARRPLHA